MIDGIKKPESRILEDIIYQMWVETTEYLIKESSEYPYGLGDKWKVRKET